jgi:hypothetical protein
MTGGRFLRSKCLPNAKQAVKDMQLRPERGNDRRSPDRETQSEACGHGSRSDRARQHDVVSAG